MKQSSKWFAAVLAMAGGLAIANSAHAQYTSTVLSDFHNFNLSATYANWDVDGSSTFNGGFGFTPIITSGPTSYEVVAQGYGSGAYNFASPVSVPGATMWQLTFTLNTTTAAQWQNPELTISDGTHQVHMQYTGSGFLNYNNYGGPQTYTISGPLTDGFGGLPLDTTSITAFNIGWDPAGYGNAATYDITYGNLSLLTPVPEPGTLALIGMGAAGLIIARRRSKLS